MTGRVAIGIALEGGLDNPSHIPSWITPPFQLPLQAFCLKVSWILASLNAVVVPKKLLLAVLQNCWLPGAGSRLADSG